MGIMRLIGKLFGTSDNPSDVMNLDGTTEATLSRSLSVLPPGEQGWITFAEARTLFSTKGAEYAFGETDDDGRRNIETFAALHRSIVNFMPIEAGSISYRSNRCDECCGGKRRGACSGCLAHKGGSNRLSHHQQHFAVTRGRAYAWPRASGDAGEA
jgi:hypothetical protein